MVRFLINVFFLVDAYFDLNVKWSDTLEGGNYTMPSSY